MTVALVITDGRQRYMTRMMASAAEMIPDFHPIVINDSGDIVYQDWLDKAFPAKYIVHNNRRGLAGAVRTAWLHALSLNQEYVLHLEDDFIFPEPVPIDHMNAIMDEHPDLAQISLKRQAWSPEEKAAGGFMEVDPSLYVDRNGWCKHEHLFTFNPCLVRTKAMAVALGSDESDGLERGVTDALLAKGYYFGIFGDRRDPPRCTHIGEHHSPGYRW